MLQFSFIGLSFLINNNKYLVPIHNKIKMLQPQEIIDLTLTKSYKPDGWSYSQLSNNLNNIDSVAIINNQNVAILSDKFSNIDDNLDISNHLHYYKYIPSSIDSLINLFIKKNIDFQVFDVPLSNNIQIPFIFQFIGGYLILSFFLTIISNFFGNNGMNGSNGMNPFN
jgi:hypothetical protein